MKPLPEGGRTAVAERPEHGGGVKAQGHGVRACQRSVGTRAFSSSTQLRTTWIVGHMRQEHLDGDGAIQAGVPDFVDLAHAPSAERGLDLVGTEPGAGWQRHHSTGRESKPPKMNRYTMEGMQMSVVLTRSATLVKDTPSR